MKKQEILVRSIKILDIGYIAVLYFIPAIVLANLVDYVYGDLDEKAELKKPLWQRALELIGILWLNAILFYIVKNVVELIPSPFHGLYGFDHYRVRDLTSASMFVFVFLFAQKTFRSRITFFRDHLA